MLLFSVQLALAQSETRGFSAQTYRPPIDAQTSLWTERSTTGPAGFGSAQVFGVYTGRPLVYRIGGDEVLVSDVLGLDLTGGVRVDRFRLGAHVPLFVGAAGPAVDQGAGLGDVMLDFKATVLDDRDAPLGAALAIRAMLPTATVDAPLGQDQTALELLALADKQIDRVVLAANVGLRGGSRVELGDVALEDQFLYRAAASYLLGRNLRDGLSLDLAGQVNLVAPNEAGAPLEGMLGGFAHVGSGLLVRGGVGAALASGVGAAETGRVVLGVSYAPERNPDTDRDGIVGVDDQCPRDAEDRDGYADADGCPDAGRRVAITAKAPDGRAVTHANVALTAGAWAESGTGEIVTTLEPGTYAMRITAEGYEPLDVPLDITEGDYLELSPVLQPRPGELEVRLTDYRGRPVKGEWSVDRATWTAAGSPVTIPVGLTHVYTRAPGHLDADATVDVRPALANVATVKMGAHARLVGDQLELAQAVRFDTASSAIRRDRYALLDEVAAILVEHRELAALRVDAYTDSQGSESSNQVLSDRRAAAVAAYLKSRGVAGTRLIVQGHGEANPIAPNDTAAGRERNRRVELTISREPVARN